MEKNHIRLLIVDDNLEICDILTDFFRLTEEVEVCAVAHNGKDALFLIARHQPDVVLLDLIMPQMDGISVLEQLSRAELAVRPKVIVASAVEQEGFTRASLERGAVYYMMKPYDLNDLLGRVCLAAREPAAPATPAGPGLPEDFEAAVTRAAMELGLPSHMKGCQYTISAVQMLLRENRPCSIVKEVYAGLALEYATSPECVEGAIRKAIRRAWEGENSPLRARMEDGEKGPPSNGRFLTAMAQHIRLYGSVTSEAGA